MANAAVLTGGGRSSKSSANERSGRAGVDELRRVTQRLIGDEVLCVLGFSQAVLLPLRRRSKARSHCVQEQLATLLDERRVLGAAERVERVVEVPVEGALVPLQDRGVGPVPVQRAERQRTVGNRGDGRQLGEELVCARMIAQLRLDQRELLRDCSQHEVSGALAGGPFDALLARADARVDQRKTHLFGFSQAAQLAQRIGILSEAQVVRRQTVRSRVEKDMLVDLDGCRRTAAQ